jgi:carboxylesterase type B
MLFIHGGAFYMGTYLGMGPKELLEKDVVLVEIQYRLGPLGFMCLDHDEAAGNMGMLDQVREGFLVGHREY